MSDSLNELGKILRTGGDNADYAVKRATRNPRRVERVLDAFDSLRPFNFTFETSANEQQLTLDLYFKQPPLNNCCSGNICAVCETFTAGYESIQLTRGYIAHSVSVTINGKSRTEFTETNPSAGLVTLNISVSPGSAVRICYTYSVQPLNQGDTVTVIGGGSIPTSGPPGTGVPGTGGTTVITPAPAPSVQVTPFGLVPEGFGNTSRVRTVANRQQTEFRLTAHSGTGAGTIHDYAANGAGKRLVSMISGAIDVGGGILTFTGDDYFIDGSAAPSAGFYFVGGPLWFQGVNGLVLHNFEHAGGWAGGQNADGITITQSCTNWLVDHLSVFGFGDEGISPTQSCTDGTVQWCLIGPGNDPAHSFGMLNSYTNARTTVHHNAWVSLEYRNPMVSFDEVGHTDATEITADVGNNVVVNCRYGMRATEGAWANFRNNYIDATNTAIETSLRAQVYESGNTSVHSTALQSNLGSPISIPSYAQFAMTSASTAVVDVKAGAGASPRSAQANALFALFP